MGVPGGVLVDAQAKICKASPTYGARLMSAKYKTHPKAKGKLSLSGYSRDAVIHCDPKTVVVSAVAILYQPVPFFGLALETMRTRVAHHAMVSSMWSGAGERKHVARSRIHPRVSHAPPTRHNDAPSEVTALIECSYDVHVLLLLLMFCCCC